VNQLIVRERVYRPSEVAKALRVSSVTVSRAIRCGKLKAFRVGGQWRIVGSDILTFVDDGTNTALQREDAGRDAPKETSAASGFAS
jgi:excisionase family DNA binding protein